MKALEVHNLRKEFFRRDAKRTRGRKRRRRVAALEGVTFTIERGECVAILGQNGSGKSTLVRLLSTLLINDGGEARIFGHDAFREAKEIRRLHRTGVYHGDLKATNVLVQDGTFLFVDLDRVRFSEDVPDRDRIFNLAQLNASLTPPLTRTDRLRFLRAYFGRCASLRKQERRWIGEIMNISIARKHRWP